MTIPLPDLNSSGQDFFAAAPAVVDGSLDDKTSMHSSAPSVTAKEDSVSSGLDSANSCSRAERNC